MSNPARAAALLISCALFLLAFVIYANHVYLLGFPDGFISEQQRAQRQLAYVFIAVSVAVGAYLFYCGALVPRSGGGWPKIVAGYLAFVLGVWLVDYFYCAKLMGSGGG
jgi:hypothetical protein